MKLQHYNEDVLRRSSRQDAGSGSRLAAYYAFVVFVLSLGVVAAWSISQDDGAWPGALSAAPREEKHAAPGPKGPRYLPQKLTMAFIDPPAPQDYAGDIWQAPIRPPAAAQEPAATHPALAPAPRQSRLDLLAPRAQAPAPASPQPANPGAQLMEMTAAHPPKPPPAFLQSVIIAAPAQKVWARIATFGDMSWHPRIVNARGGVTNGAGSTRILSIMAHGPVSETLADYDAAGMSYAYNGSSPPRQSGAYRSKLSVTALGAARSKVAWRLEFLTGESAARAASAAEIQRAGLVNLKAALEKRS